MGESGEEEERERGGGEDKGMRGKVHEDIFYGARDRE